MFYPSTTAFVNSYSIFIFSLFFLLLNQTRQVIDINLMARKYAMFEKQTNLSNDIRTMSLQRWG